MFFIKTKINQPLPKASVALGKARVDKYPLITKKRADFILFKKVIDLMVKGEHLTKEGLEKIVCIKASRNKGLSEQLKTLFKSVIPVERPEVTLNSLVIDPQ
jgi:hypothetical protein